MKSDRKVKVYTIRIPLSEIDPIEELARDFHMSKNDVFRNALKLYAVLKYAEKNGKEVLIRDTKTGQIERLIFT